MSLGAIGAIVLTTSPVAAQVSWEDGEWLILAGIGVARTFTADSARQSQQ